MKVCFRKAVCLFVLIAGCGVVQGFSQQEIRDLLLTARENSRQRTFQAEEVRKSDNCRLIHYQMRSPDGNTVLKRRDLFRANRLMESKLFNEAGWFLIIDDVAGKDEYANFDWGPGSVIEPEKLSMAKLSMTESNYHGIPCRQVTVKFSTDDDAIVKLTGNSIQFVRENRDRMLNNVGFREVYLIGEADDFIYSTRIFNGKGMEIYDLNLTKVQLDVALNPELFQISPDARQATFSTEEEMKAVFGQPAPSPLSRLGGWLSSLWPRDITTLSGWLLTVGILALAAAGWWRHHRRKSATKI